MRTLIFCLLLGIETFFCLLLGLQTTFSQTIALTSENIQWQHLDPYLNSIYGISTNRAHMELQKKNKNKTVIVAVIDAGIDLLHEDLKSVLWHNENERGLDEDHNGYKNDRFGWNFLGIKLGNNPFLIPGLEYQRLYLSRGSKYSSFLDNNLSTSRNKDCIFWLSIKKKFKADSAVSISSTFIFWEQLAIEDVFWRKALNKEAYTAKDILAFKKKCPTDNVNQFILSSLNRDSLRTNQRVFVDINKAKVRLLKRYSQDPVQHRLETIGDNYNSIKDKFYGDFYVSNSNSSHGTHVAGIVGAERNNDIGIDGIADAVEIMPIRVVPSGADEYDKDVALAIRYAVDNGANVINMSFGKSYSPQQKWVEDAIRHAARNDVLIVHAAGNDASNTDSTNHYPTSKYLNGRYAPNMITVGASGAKMENLIGGFSNYGKVSVDVFAPGIDIYSTVNNNGYKSLSGTSMAAPVVAGLAALLRSYYPKLTAVQVKDIIERSVTKIDFPVVMPGKKGKLVPMTELCKSGGIVNAYNAVLLADQLINKKFK